VGLTGGPITSTGTIDLADTAVAPGSYTYASITVDQQGRLTAASDGVAPVPTTVAVTSPITNTGTPTAANIGIQTATTGQLGAVQVGTNINVAAGVISVDTSSTTQSGIVQLNNTVTSLSTTEALTAAQGKNLQDQISALAVTSNLTFAGTFDAATSQMLSVTASGTSAGFVVGSDLPSPVAGITDYFVIITTGGSYSPPGGGGPYTTAQGDWFLCDGTVWQFLNVGTDLPIASTGTAGIVELATSAETQTGTDTTRAVTPAGAAATYVPISDFTAKGDLLSATGANTQVALPVGADGTVLTACAAAPTGLCWTPAATPSIPCACITGKGAIITGTAANTPVALPVGSTDGFSLVVCAACAEGITWALATPSSATPTVEGIVFGCTASGNAALGFNSLLSITTGADNVAIGSETGCALTTGGCNTLVGRSAGCSLTGGCFNVLMGHFAGCGLALGNGNLMLGNSAGRLMEGCLNTFLGDLAGSLSTAGCRNVAIGHSVEVASPTGDCQLAIGFDIGCNWITGDSNKNIRPGAGVLDCAGNLGVAGQFLCSTGTAIEWVTGMGDTPVGAVQWFSSTTAPVGWLVADGRAVSRASYSALFAVVGTTYGAGDGTSTFNLPDLRGMFLRGVDNAGGTARGCDPGRVFGSTQQDEFQSHLHGLYQWNAVFTAGSGGPASSFASGSCVTCYNKMTSEGGTETRPMNVAMLPCIKYEVTIAPLTPTSGIPCACITGKGAIVIGDGANSPTALPVGTNGQVLFANSNCAQGAEWAFPPGTNYEQCVAGVTTVFGNATTQVAGITITTVGNPVQISAYGDVYGSNSGASYLGRYFIRRCGTPNVDFRAGWYESTNGNVNVPMALTYIDNPPPGTYCYALMVANGGNTVVVGETGGPVLNAYEMGSACFPDAIPCTCITGKGSLITGTALNAPTALPVGNDGTVLRPNSACPNGLEWSQVGKTVSGICNDSVALVIDNLRFRMVGATQNFQFSLAGGSETVTWANSGVINGGYATGAVCQNISMTTSWRELCGGYVYNAHGAIQCATICYGYPVRCAYQFVGIVGYGYNNNVMCITRIL